MMTGPPYKRARLEIPSLPRDIVATIGGFLTLKEAATARQVCRQWRDYMVKGDRAIEIVTAFVTDSAALEWLTARGLTTKLILQNWPAVTPSVMIELGLRENIFWPTLSYDLTNALVHRPDMFLPLVTVGAPFDFTQYPTIMIYLHDSGLRNDKVPDEKIIELYRIMKLSSDTPLRSWTRAVSSAEWPPTEIRRLLFVSAEHKISDRVDWLLSQYEFNEAEIAIANICISRCIPCCVYGRRCCK